MSGTSRLRSTMTRRRWLGSLGTAGGNAAVYSALRAKTIDEGLLILEITEQDTALLIEFLIAEGQLAPDTLDYLGSSRRGYEVLAGAGYQPGVLSSPIPGEELLPLAAETMRWSAAYLAATATFDQQETMMEPIGGMATLWEQGFHPRLDEILTLNAEVIEIRQSESEVRIAYRDRESGEEVKATGDYCICTIPLPVLREIPSDFSDDFAEAIAAVQYLAVGKSGIQFKRHFWEEDDWIYGGITYTNIPQIATIAYPDEFEHGVAIAWQNMPYQRGGWATYDNTHHFYPRLLEPDGRVYLSGDHLSYLPGWQAGAIQSAWQQI